MSLGSGGPEGASREEDAKVAVKEMGREGKSEGEELKERREGRWHWSQSWGSELPRNRP